MTEANPQITDYQTSEPNEALVAFTFDLDPDSFESSIGEHRTDRLTWRGIEEGVPLLRDLLARYRDAAGRGPRCTWFVRADDQIAKAYGDAGHILDTHDALLRELATEGHEIGWHPHLYRQVENGWVQETDEAALADQMHRSVAAMRQRGWRPLCSRIGENFGSNGVMAALEDLEIAYDSTAMPGRQRADGERSFDWGATPTCPYRPGRADFRRPGKPAVNVVEVPLSMVSVTADYDVVPLSRYVDLAFHPRALHDGLVAHLKKARFLITVSHPSCVLPQVAEQPRGLLSFDIDAFHRNLETMLDEYAQLGRPVRFVTLSEGAAAMCGEV